MRQIIKSLYDQLSGFLKGTSGSISTLFSFMMLPLVAVLGVSVDLVQQGMMRVEVEQAADAALLAATRVINVEPDAEFSKMQQIATQQFSANLENPSSLNVVKLLFGRDPDTGQTNLDVEVRIKTNFISIFGLQETSIKTKPTAFASVETESSPNVDMVMVVDVSGSMSGSKINALRNAATDLTNIILPEGHQESRIGIVPFNSGVVNPWVLDLTSDVPSILDGISALNAGGGTNSFAGIQRGQTIMEDGDTPTYESHRKVVILLTDGMNNSSQNNTHTINTCAELKNDDVDVYTIGFGNIGGSALSMLEDCATSEDTYFHVQNSSQLSDVFKYIATEYTFLRLSS